MTVYGRQELLKILDASYRPYPVCQTTGRRKPSVTNGMVGGGGGC